MEPKYTYSQGSDLPETVPVESSIHKYSVPESGMQAHTTVYSLPTDDASSPIPTYTDDEKPRNEQSKWTRWPLLLLYGLLLMIIAGLAGGFIGKSIERNSSSSSTAVTAASDSCPTAISSGLPLSSSTPTTPNPSASAAASSAPAATQSSAVFQRTISTPPSGCDSTKPYASFKARSLYLAIPYTQICGQGWFSYDITAMNVATQSDCIESCSMYNSQHKDSSTKCVGGGFIPSWWDQKLAMKESGITPYNCFLKTNTSGITRNNDRWEVVALCMEGECDNIVG